ncbi:hypothetical protein CPB97_002472 [Podila verticillata]|nr:hypothetical protein CPB97_002472 [Podila verticillata]
MTQLLESTRNYLRSSTKIGRRLSHRDQSSGSETSLHPSITSTQPSPPSSTGGREANPRRSSTYTRLSALFSLDNLSKKDTVTSSNHSGVLSKVTLEVERSSEDKKRKKASRRSTSRLSDNPTLGKKSKGTDLPLLVIQAEQQQNKQKPYKQPKHEEVPRGRSPTLSMSHTLHTVASSYDTHPSDYSSMTQYEAHVWRRNLLEESIMHSLRLGWGESPSSRRSRSRSVKRGTRSRKSRDASGIYKGPCPANEDGVQIRNRALLSPNSPYMMQLNPSTSTTNITHSFASFTLELDEHQVPHIMASSVIPNLFMIKGPSPLSSKGEPRGRKDSNARSIVGRHAPSPRVLNGKLPHTDKDRREISKENQDPRAFVSV